MSIARHADSLTVRSVLQAKRLATRGGLQSMEIGYPAALELESLEVFQIILI